MILVLLGTQNNDFHRLLCEIEENIDNGIIKQEVVVQAGFTKYHSEKMRIFNLIPQNDLNKLVEKASLIITHAGIGSIEMALEKNKKVIAVARKKKYGEHVNDHQKDIEKKFNDSGLLIGIDDVNDLKYAIIKSERFYPKKYQKNNSEMINIIKTYIDKI